MSATFSRQSMEDRDQHSTNTDKRITQEYFDEGLKVQGSKPTGAIHESTI